MGYGRYRIRHAGTPWLNEWLEDFSQSGCKIQRGSPAKYARILCAQRFSH
jgi:hypothetical protein